MKRGNSLQVNKGFIVGFGSFLKSVAQVAVAPVAVVVDTAIDVVAPSINNEIKSIGDDLTGGQITNYEGAIRGDWASAEDLGKYAFSAFGGAEAIGGSLTGSSGNMDFLKDLGSNLGTDFLGSVISKLGLNGNAPGSGTIPAETLLNQTQKAIDSSNYQNQQLIMGMQKKTMLYVGGAVAVMVVVMLFMRRK